MRALIISDIHGNIDALLAMETQMKSYGRIDEIIVLGDLVDFGPAPAEVIAWIRQNCGHVIRGNHDHAMATGVDCKSSKAYLELSQQTRKYFQTRLDDDAIDYLGQLPTYDLLLIDGYITELVHATPRNPLYEYMSANANQRMWIDALKGAEECDFVFLGHTHLPFVKKIGSVTIINPGSLGLPKDGDPRGCFAIWEDGKISLHRISYDVERAVRRIKLLDLPGECKDRLSNILRTGGRL